MPYRCGSACGSPGSWHWDSSSCTVGRGRPSRWDTSPWASHPGPGSRHRRSAGWHSSTSGVPGGCARSGTRSRSPCTGTRPLWRARDRDIACVTGWGAPAGSRCRMSLPVCPSLRVPPCVFPALTVDHGGGQDGGHAGLLWQQLDVRVQRRRVQGLAGLRFHPVVGDSRRLCHHEGAQGLVLPQRTRCPAPQRFVWDGGTAVSGDRWIPSCRLPGPSPLSRLVPAVPAAAAASSRPRPGDGGVCPC